MPRSSKPRKRYTPKMCTSQIFLPQSSIDGVRELFKNAEGIVLLKLRQGQCDYADAQILRDCLNLATTIYVTEDGVSGWHEEEDDLFEKLRETFHQWWTRGNEAGGLRYEGKQPVIDGSVRYICKADEIPIFLDGYDLVFSLIHAELDARPQQLLKQYDAMKEVIGGLHKTGRITFEYEDLRRRLKKIMGKF